MPYLHAMHALDGFKMHTVVVVPIFCLRLNLLASVRVIRPSDHPMPNLTNTSRVFYPRIMYSRWSRLKKTKSIRNYNIPISLSSGDIAISSTPRACSTLQPSAVKTKEESSHRTDSTRSAAWLHNILVSACLTRGREYLLAIDSQ